MRLPTVDDFTSATVTDTYDDMISPPGLTNHWAVAQVDHDVVAVRSLNVPPISQGDSVSARLYLDGALAQASGQGVDVAWRPDRVTRSTAVNGWRVETVTVCPPGQPAVLVRIDVTNDGPDRELRLGLWIDSTVTRSGKPWLRAEPPQAPNRLEADGARRWGIPDGDDAVSLQGLLGSPDGLVTDGGRVIEVAVDLASGQHATYWYAHAIAGDRDAALAAWDAIEADPEGAVEAARETWNHELAAMFTPDNEIFEGHLPALETDNDALRELYWWGAMGTLWFRRTNPASVLGTVYDTLMPRYWQTTTFIWDYSLSSWVHAQLEPDVMRRQILHWVGLDINSHFGTEWVTGHPVGYWYSVNQYALVRLTADYVRFTGDVDFLDVEVEGPDGSTRSMIDHVRDWSLAWQDKRNPSGLADYGGIDNLLECVSTYVHEVASLQAANVWSMRTAAELSRLRGETAEAERLEAEAEALLPKVLELYRPGDGFFDARYPDGTRHATRHCYDFATVGTTIAADLPEEQRAEMVRFFEAELRSPSWMRALSPKDGDAGFSVRPDHQWNGAYPAWPADAGRASIALGGRAGVMEWVEGLRRTTRQGPPGQAHFVEEAAPTVDGGARKAPGQYPYLIDWACSSAGSWCEFIVGGVLGVEVGIDGAVTAEWPSDVAGSLTISTASGDTVLSSPPA
ncbi:hypothetical protein BW730_11395 [Tessaracoccus aquimaris]|uniref:Alpha-L-rhamnosidase six-hairpin glycosidase domain-containing protein n=1 Tax=Tessaracoccus aquimaris TaxID=1332264 RepID=A0A1Q2CPG4_9ACTN|nr:hypothetical protein [Tessaracoccus aquimaris]AQP48002.1 hypothetical protein BW730_11395 [Tessaracoccus aquimaris]